MILRVDSRIFMSKTKIFESLKGWRIEGLPGCGGGLPHSPLFREWKEGVGGDWGGGPGGNIYIRIGT